MKNLALARMLGEIAEEWMRNNLGVNERTAIEVVDTPHPSVEVVDMLYQPQGDALGIARRGSYTVVFREYAFGDNGRTVRFRAHYRQETNTFYLKKNSVEVTPNDR